MTIRVSSTIFAYPHPVAMRTIFVSTSLLALTAASSVAQQVNSYGNPEKRAPRPTTATISEADLMSRLYVFADDSMEGRNAPLASNARGQAYLVRELQRLKIAPIPSHLGVR